MSEVNKVVLAYSGGLDTSVILKWLQDTYQCEVVTFTADLGQGEELEPARAKALQFGIKPENIFIDDLREEFVRDFVFPMFRCNTVYEGEYLLGTSIARPLIAKRQIEIARATGAEAVSHGATGKGNDQVRFELGYYALMPGVKVIAPWREWDLLSREKLLAYAEKNGIPIEMKHKQGGSPYSMDANLLHISFEGRHLEDPSAEAEEPMWRWTVSPEAAPDAAEYLDLEFEKGDLVSINGTKMKPHELLAKLNELGGKHGIGRLDLVENRYVGMKSRGCYETPGDHPGSRSRPPQGRPDAALRQPDLHGLLVVAGTSGAADPDRSDPADGQRMGSRQALQGQRHRGRARLEDRLPVRSDYRYLRRRPRRLQPEGCSRLHPAERAAHAHRLQREIQTGLIQEIMDPSAPLLFGLTVAEFEDISLKLCVGGLIAYMIFIIGQLAFESKAGKYGAIWMFVGLGVGFIGFAAKSIIQRLLGIE